MKNLKNKIIVLVVFLSGCGSEPKNFPECVLSDMPGTSNNVIRYKIYKDCKDRFPNMKYDITKGYASGLFSEYKDQDECLIDKAKYTSNNTAVANIRSSCDCLYEKPRFNNEMCDYDQTNINYAELVEVR